MEQIKPRPKGTAHVRQSKFRHLFGTPGQTQDCTFGVNLGSVQVESIPLRVNSHLFAAPWNVSGCVVVLPISFKGSLCPEQPLIIHDEKSVNDFNFNPFDDQLLATACSDGTVSLWRIPDGGLTGNLSNPERSLEASDKRLLNVYFHPLASDVLATIDAGKTIKLFDLEGGQERFTFPNVHKAIPTNLSWNALGNLCATCCKDKILRVFDPRANRCVGETPDHPGTKGSHVLWLGRKDRLLTIGFGKNSERQMALYDPRNLGTRLSLQTIDNASSSLMTFYDNDNGIIFLGGKGDGNIRYYEVTDEEPFLFFLNEFKSKDPQSGLAVFPKQCCDVMKCEIMRFLKITPQGTVFPIRFEVPRVENVYFQEDIFPDTWDGKPSMRSSEWFSGVNKEAQLVSLNPEKQK